MLKFLAKVAVYIVMIFGFCVLLFCLIDPYNVYHWNAVRNNGIEPNKNYIKTKYIISNPTRFDSFILGSSRVGALHVEKLCVGKTYNMTYSQATVEEELDTLEMLIAGDVKINTIYLGVDNASFCNGIDYHYDSPMHCSYSKAQNPAVFFRVFMRPNVCFKSLFEHGNVNEGFRTFYEYGWDIDYNRVTNYDWDNVKPVFNEHYDLDYVLECIRKIKRVCDDNGIRLIVFTNPMYEVTYKAAVDYNDYYSFLIELSEIVDYYNFSSINTLTVNSDNYIDLSHYRAEVGDIMLDIIAGEGTKYAELQEQGFGFHVTNGNIDELMDILIKQYPG